MKRHLLLIILVVCLGDFVQAQHLPLFTQYRDQIGILNPGAFSHDYLINDDPLSFGLSFRRQWLGLESGPVTQTIRGEYFFESGGAVNLVYGGHLVNDQTGPTGFTGLYGRAGALISNNPYYGGLSLGFNFGLVQYRVKASELKLRDLNDLVGINDQSKLFPDVGVGVYYYKYIDNGFLDDSHIYAGFSVPQVIGLDLDFITETGTISTQRIQHLYGLIGLYKYLKGDTYLEPSMWFKYVPGAPMNLDLNVRYQMNGNFWLGAGGSTAGTVHLETGFILGENYNLNNNFKIGYGFDYSFSSFGPEIGSTHEINLSYSIGR